MCSVLHLMALISGNCFSAPSKKEAKVTLTYLVFCTDISNFIGSQQSFFFSISILKADINLCPVVSQCHFYHFSEKLSPIHDAVLVTNRSCACDTPITSAIMELSVFACFNSATNSEFASLVVFLPLLGRIRDFHPLETCAARRTNTKGPR